jgi:hypothetical protein
MSRVLNVMMERFIALTCDGAEHDRWRQVYVDSHNRIVTVFQELSRQ